MRTIREKLHDLLQERGLFPDEAADIVKRFANSDVGNPIRNCLDHPFTEYQPELIPIIWELVQNSAIEWIILNGPKDSAHLLFTC